MPSSVELAYIRLNTYLIILFCSAGALRERNRVRIPGRKVAAPVRSRREEGTDISKLLQFWTGSFLCTLHISIKGNVVTLTIMLPLGQALQHQPAAQKRRHRPSLQPSLR